MPDPRAHSNRLIHESSPYLLQHAHNPVDWFAWGPEAFEKARRENKPIFLSVGYSTCYWCHVMERESFENEAVAAEMNRLFVSIKVDREERPDVDQLYMTAVQLLTRHGGWPMSVWLTPDLRPFHGGTYYPAANFVNYLRALDDAYRNRLPEVEQNAQHITQILKRLARPAPPEKPLSVDGGFVAELVARSVGDYDDQSGGFGGAPKFPRQTLLELMLVCLDSNLPALADLKPQLDAQLRHALDAMADGGIRDQLGGGFHRYSTDAHWLVPHFEIMLYDNAMLGLIYARASRQTGESRYAQVARGIFDFVLREMTSPDGAFYTAFDAEVDAQEGLSYLWTASEIETILGAEDAALFNHVYGLELGPNFADPHHGTGSPDKNVLYLPRPMADVAAEMSLSPQQLISRLAPLRQTLYDARRKRKQPSLDTKIITSWNALMIRALAEGGRALNEPRYLSAAARAADYLLDRHRIDGKLHRTMRQSDPGHPGLLDDYSFLAQALTALADASGEASWKTKATAVVHAMIERFKDEASGGFYFTPRDTENLIVRQMTAQDSPLPSGNAVATMALLELGQSESARDVLATFARQTADQGEGMSSMVQAMLLYLERSGPLAVSPASSEVRPASPGQIAAGVVSVEPTWVSPSELHLRLHIENGFHINANQIEGSIPLIATRLTADSPGATIEFPPGDTKQFAFSGEPVRVYSGEVIARVVLAAALPAGAELTLSLTYQACDDSACFAPVTRAIRVSAPGAS